jgi:hypothetical protein
MTVYIVTAARYLAGILIALAGVFVFMRSQAFPAIQNSRGDAVIHDENRPPARLIFACDGSTNELKMLFSPELVDKLRQLNSGVAFSTDDFGPDRVELVRELNRAGIPTVASIVLDADQGYYVKGAALLHLRLFHDFSMG